MALVRLHTQHHEAGGLAPATPTCCCCSCCCVGSTVGTLAVLPVMVALGGLPPRSESQAPAPDPNDSATYRFPARPARPARGYGIRAWGAGLVALAAAIAPFPIAQRAMGSDLDSSEGVNLMPAILPFLAAFIGLAVWGAVRANRAGRPVWPPLVVAFACLPVAFAFEFNSGGPMLDDHNSSYGWLAFGIGASIFAFGVLASWNARRS